MKNDSVEPQRTGGTGGGRNKKRLSVELRSTRGMGPLKKKRQSVELRSTRGTEPLKMTKCQSAGLPGARSPEKKLSVEQQGYQGHEAQKND